MCTYVRQCWSRDGSRCGRWGEVKVIFLYKRQDKEGEESGAKEVVVEWKTTTTLDLIPLQG